MAWLVGIVIFIALIYFCIKNKWARYTLLIIIFGCVGIYFYYDQSSKRELEISKKRISLNEIQLVNMQLSSPWSTCKMTGRVRNLSKTYKLTEIDMDIFIIDQEINKGEIIGQTRETIWLKVPPMQSRDIDEYVHFTGMKNPIKKWEWNLKINYLRGE